MLRDRWMRDPVRTPQPPTRGAGFESVSWHHALDLVRSIRMGVSHQTPPTERDLAEIAVGIAAQAPDMEGEMPLEVEMFVREYHHTPPNPTAP